MFEELIDINKRPACFSIYTAEELWTEPYTAKQMLRYHLNKELPMASRKHTFIDQSANWIAEHFNLGSGKKVADFGCGPGLYALRLARTGANVTGVDFSANSLAYARETAKQEGVEIEYQQMNYLNFSSKDRYDLIVMIMCDYCVLSPSQRALLLSIFKKHLSPQGRVMLDVNTMNAYKEREEVSTYERRQLNGFWSPDDYFGFVNTFKYDDKKVVLDKYTIIEEHRARVVYNWFQHFDLASLSSEVESNGFVIEETYSDVAGGAYRSDSNEMAVVLRLM
ncbi:MAG: class I SAM-dependent methyltransferase [Desulfuromonas sp.]|nr:MAG: class I SAM-dependent methyltransferase [Desulfuromonas sp.]